MMPATPNVVISWSSGKDCAWALHALRQAGAYSVAALLTTYDEKSGRIGMHGTPLAVARRQAESAGLPLIAAPMPYPAANDRYEAVIAEAWTQAQRAYDATHIAFGDLFLADIRSYRDALCSRIGAGSIYPLWMLPTRELAQSMIRGGLRAMVSCIDTQRLPPQMLAREFDDSFLNDLPAGIDPCAENGEFHTIATDGPMFRQPISLDLRGQDFDGRFAVARFAPDET